MDEHSSLLEYVLRFADSDLVLAQRLGEWAGKAPVLEEDIALTNVGLDLLGQARLWFAYAGEVEAQARGRGRNEDEFAFLRDGSAFRNLLLSEQPMVGDLFGYPSPSDVTVVCTNVRGTTGKRPAKRG